MQNFDKFDVAMQNFDKFDVDTPATKAYGYDQPGNTFPRSHAGTTLPAPPPAITSPTLRSKQPHTLQDSNRHVINHSKEAGPSFDPISATLSESAARAKAVTAMSKKIVEDRMGGFSETAPIVHSRVQQRHTPWSPPHHTRPNYRIRTRQRVAFNKHPLSPLASNHGIQTHLIRARFIPSHSIPKHRVCSH